MKAAFASRVKRIVRWSLAIFLVTTVIAGIAGSMVWYSLFGRVGDPVAEFELSEQEAELARQWQQCEAWFEQMNLTLRRTRDLRGTLMKQERIGDRLEPMATIHFKVRKRPLSIYLRWIEPSSGRELIFEQKKRGNHVLAHEGPPLRAVSPDVLMPLRHPLAMKFSRHPVSELSLQYIIQQMPAYLADAKANPGLEIAFEENQSVHDVPCVHIRFRHPAETMGPEDYCRFDLYLDQDSKMPLRWERYAFAEDGSEELIEYYEIKEYVRNPNLEDADFDPANPEYGFNSNWVMEL